MNDINLQAKQIPDLGEFLIVQLLETMDKDSHGNKFSLVISYK